MLNIKKYANYIFFWKTLFIKCDVYKCSIFPVSDNTRCCLDWPFGFPYKNLVGTISPITGNELQERCRSVGDFPLNYITHNTTVCPRHQRSLSRSNRPKRPPLRPAGWAAPRSAHKWGAVRTQEVRTVPPSRCFVDQRQRKQAFVSDTPVCLDAKSALLGARNVASF